MFDFGHCLTSDTGNWFQMLVCDVTHEISLMEWSWQRLSKPSYGHLHLPFWKRVMKERMDSFWNHCFFYFGFVFQIWDVREIQRRRLQSQYARPWKSNFGVKNLGPSVLLPEKDTSPRMSAIEEIGTFSLPIPQVEFSFSKLIVLLFEVYGVKHPVHCRCFTAIVVTISQFRLDE